MLHFLDRETVLCLECNNTNITYHQLYSCLRWYFTHSKYCYVTLWFPPPVKLHICHYKLIFSHSFWPRWLKQTFCTELEFLDHHICSFCIFNLFPVKKNTTQTKNRKIKKKYIYVSKFYSSKIQKNGNVTIILN